MAWKRFSPKKTITGPGRIALSPSVVADPTTFASMMNTTTYDYVSPYVDLGPTDGGVTIAKGFAEQVYSHDHSSEVKSEVTGNTLTIQATLAEAGLISRFDYSWLTASGTTNTGDSLGVYKGIAAAATLPHRSCVVGELDENPKLRLFWIRDTVPVAQEASYAMTNAAIHTLPISLRAYQNSSVTNAEYGYIFEQNNFGV